MSNHNISLIIPAYNEEKYIGKCLDSVMRYAAGKFHEIIVVDNNSTDKTKEVAQSFDQVKVITEKQKGITFVRECGFRNSSGDILVYIDADTCISKGWFEKIGRSFKDLKVVCSSGPYIFYDASFIQQSVTWLYWILLGLPMYWILGYMVVGGNFAITRPTLEKMNGFDTSIVFYGEDTDIARRAHAFGKISFALDFFIHSSSRRLQQEGWLRVGWKYITNFLSEVFRKKPVTNIYYDIR